MYIRNNALLTDQVFSLAGDWPGNADMAGLFIIFSGWPGCSCIHPAAAAFQTDRGELSAYRTVGESNVQFKTVKRISDRISSGPSGLVLSLD